MSKSRKNPLLVSPPSAGERLRSTLHALQQTPGFRLGATYFAASLVSLSIFMLLSARLYTQQTELMIHEYGNTVAQQLAQSCVDTVVRGDLVSLHAQLEKLTDMDSIVDVAVYDMENHLLAQASSATKDRNKIPEEAIRNFPASISFQDSLAGKVIISLNTQNIMKQRHWLSIYLACGSMIALGLIILISKYWSQQAQAHYQTLVANLNKMLTNTSTLSGFEHASPAWAELLKKIDHLDEHLRYLEQRTPAPRFTQSGKYTYKPTEGSYAELMIECSNFKQLQQQLHHRELQRLLDHFQEQLGKAGKLYHGVNIHSPGDHILLRFLINDVMDASLQAICCAVLLKGLLKNNTPESTTNINLEFRFAVHWHAHDERQVPELLHNHLLQTEYLEMQHLCQLAKPGEILATKGIKQSPAVAEHIKLDLISGESDTDTYRVLRISDSYKKLLEQQIQQLNTAFTTSG